MFKEIVKCGGVLDKGNCMVLHALGNVCIDHSQYFSLLCYAFPSFNLMLSVLNYYFA